MAAKAEYPPRSGTEADATEQAKKWQPDDYAPGSVARRTGVDGVVIGDKLADFKSGLEQAEAEASREKVKTPERLGQERTVGEVAVLLADCMPQFEDQRPDWDSRKGGARKYIKEYKAIKNRHINTKGKTAKHKQSQQHMYSAALSMARKYHGIDNNADLGKLSDKDRADLYWTTQRIYDNFGTVQQARNAYSESQRSPQVMPDAQPAAAKREQSVDAKARDQADQEYLDQLMGQLSKSDQREVRRRAYRSVAESLAKGGDGHIDEHSQEFQELLKIATQEEAIKRQDEHAMAHTMLITAMRNVGNELRQSGVDLSKVGLKFDNNDDAEKVLAKLSPDMQAKVASELAKVRTTQYPQTEERQRKREEARRNKAETKARMEAMMEARREAKKQQATTPDQQPVEPVVKVYQLGQTDPAAANSAEPQPAAPANGEPESSAGAEPTTSNAADSLLSAMAFDPLAAVDIDRSKALDRIAAVDASNRLNQELQLADDEVNAKGRARNPIIWAKHAVARLWKGGIMKEAYLARYTRQERAKYDSLESLDMRNADGSLMTAEQIAEKINQGDDARYALIMRFGQANEAFISKRAGETRRELDHNSKSYQMLSKAIRQFASKGDDGKWLMDEDAFNEEINRVIAVEHDIDLDSKKGRKELANLASLNNYRAIAMYVRGQVEHGEALDNVMQGFKMYQGESREGARTEVYRTGVEKVVDKLTNKFHGIPPEAIVTAANVALSVSQAIARNRALQLFTFGGSAVVSGGIAMAKESARTKVDRTAMASELAVGKFDSFNYDSKYNDQIQATIADMAPAQGLIESMDQARQSGDLDQMKAAIDEVILRQAISDTDGIDLIRYSSVEAVESERISLLTHQLQLQADYISAMRQQDPDFDFDKYRDDLLGKVDQMSELFDRASADDERKNVLADMPEAARKIYDQRRDYDRAFNKLRRRRALGAGIKATAASLTVSTVAQEVAAMFNDNVRGVVEGLNGQNQDAASTTFLEGTRRQLASAMGLEQATANVAGGLPVTRRINADNVTDEQLEQWRQQGYTIETNTAQVPQTQTETVSAAEAVKGNARIHRMGWFDNGTSHSDFGELTGHGTGNGYVYNVVDHYSSSNGLSVSGSDILQSAQNGQIKLMISPTVDTQMNPFEITGHVDGGRIVFDVTPGSAEASMLSSGSFHTAEVFDASNGMVIATEVGSGTANQLTTEVAKYVEQITSYDVTAPLSQVQSAVPDVEIPTFVATTSLGRDSIDGFNSRPAPTVTQARSAGLTAASSERSEPAEPTQQQAQAASPEQQPSPAEQQPASSAAAPEEAVANSGESDHAGMTEAERVALDRAIDAAINLETHRAEVGRANKNVDEANDQLASLANKFGADQTSRFLQSRKLADLFERDDRGHFALSRQGRRLVAQYGGNIMNDVSNLAEQYMTTNPQLQNLANDEIRRDTAELMSLASVLGGLNLPQTINSEWSVASADTVDEFRQADDATREQMVLDDLTDWMDNYEHHGPGDYIYRGNYRSLVESESERPWMRIMFEPDSNKPDAKLRLTNEARAWLHDVRGRDGIGSGDDILTYDSVFNDYARYLTNLGSAVKSLNDRAYDGQWTEQDYDQQLGAARALFHRKNGDDSPLELTSEGVAAMRRYLADHNQDRESRDGDQWLDGFLADYNANHSS